MTLKLVTHARPESQDLEVPLDNIAPLTIIDGPEVDADSWFEPPLHNLSVRHTAEWSEDIFDRSIGHQRYVQRQDIALFKRCSRIVSDFPNPMSPEVLKNLLTSFKQRNPSERIGSTKCFRSWASAATWHHHRSKNLVCAVYEYASVADVDTGRFLRAFIQGWSERMNVPFTFSTVKELALALLTRMETAPDKFRLSISYQAPYKFRRKNKRERAVLSSVESSEMITELRRLKAADSIDLDELFNVDHDQDTASNSGMAAPEACQPIWSSDTAQIVQSETQQIVSEEVSDCKGSFVDLFGEDDEPKIEKELVSSHPNQNRQIFAVWREGVEKLAEVIPELCDTRKPSPAPMPLALVLLAARRSRNIPKEMAKLTFWSGFFGLTAQAVHSNLARLTAATDEKIDDWSR